MDSSDDGCAVKKQQAAAADPWAEGGAMEGGRLAVCFGCWSGSFDLAESFLASRSRTMTQGLEVTQLQKQRMDSSTQGDSFLQIDKEKEEDNGNATCLHSGPCRTNPRSPRSLLGWVSLQAVLLPWGNEVW